MGALRQALGRAVNRVRGVKGSFAPAGTLNQPRCDHTATLLSDGRVLVVGGQYGQPRPMAEVWSPAE